MEKEKIYFDAEWYLEQNPHIATYKFNPLAHFMLHGWKEGRDPSPDFNVKEYLVNHPELLELDLNPFSHIRFLPEYAVEENPIFLPECIEFKHCFHPLQRDKKYKRVAVFASFFSDGIIPDYVIYYLKELKSICDAIIFVSDCPILEKEKNKISSFVNYMDCQRHHMYDFGSYKYGIEYLRENLGLENIDELILCNDSCIAPVFPFEKMFEVMNKQKLDFWGGILSEEIILHLQSYFLVFKNQVIVHEAFKDFFNGIKRLDKRRVILNYELQLAKKLSMANFSFSAYIYSDKAQDDSLYVNRSVITYPLFLMDKKFPLIKLKNLYTEKLNHDGVKNTLKALEKHNKILYKITEKYIEKISNKIDKISEPNIYQIEAQNLHKNILQYLKKINAKTHFIFPESKLVHEYLDGLNGIEIGASSHNPFGLEKTGKYQNVDYSADFGDLWQGEFAVKPARVDVVALGDDLPFEDNSLDYVLSSHVIEHFFDPIKTIKEWLRVVHKGGYVVMIIPHKDKTFDKFRPITRKEELIQRHQGLLKPDDYAFINDENLKNAEYLPADFIIRQNEKTLPNNYSALDKNIKTSIHHYCVWDFESFLELCEEMEWNIVKALNPDDKAGNGFMIILQK